MRTISVKGMDSMRFSTDEKRVAHQMVEGEVIAIDFVSGAYFSMQGTAADIWTMLANGFALDRVVAIYRALPDAPAAVAEEIEGFVEALLDARLIERSDLPASDAAVLAPSTYAYPLLEKFEDMSELITLDPVHDVGEMGWPHAATDRG